MSQQITLDKNSDGKYEFKILKLGKIMGQVMWCDFEQVPQGYIHICGTGIKKPKGSRRFAHVNGSLIDPTDDQIIEQAKRFLRQELNVNDFAFVVTEKDFRK